MGTAQILLVDDRSEVCTAVESLATPEVRVRRAGNGERGWHRFRADGADLVISENRRSREDGLALLRRIRTVSRVPFIVLVSHAEIEDAVAAMRSGADDYLRFPGDLDRLARRMEELLRAGRSGRYDDARRGIPSLCAASASLANARAARRREEKDELVALLRECDGNVAAMGRRLELTRGAVAYRLKKHGLRP